MSSNSNSPPNLLVVDNSFMPYKPKPNPSYNKYTNNILAFFSSLFLLSIFIFFISIFKNLSFSSLFNSTIFWFFISNTLIFIIAADFALFSLSQQKSFDFYGHYSPPNPKQTHFQPQSPPLIVIDEVKDNPDDKLKIVVQGCAPPSLKTLPAKTYRRSKSEKPKRSVSKESKKMMARRLESVKCEATELEDQNEFSKMTDEELNRRVEEFIQRFNRQMRLQTRTESKFR